MSGHEPRIGVRCGAGSHLTKKRFHQFTRSHSGKARPQSSRRRLPWGGISATQAKLRTGGVDNEKFVRGVLRATRALTEPHNKNDVTNWISKFFNLDDKLADEFYRRLVPSMNPSGIVERDKIKMVIDSAVERGLTDKPLDPDSVVDFSIAKKLGS